MTDHQRKQTLLKLNDLSKRLRICIEQPSPQLLHRISTILQSLRGDIVLLCNHNFYLRCKLQDKGKEYRQMQIDMEKMQQHAALELDMMRTRFEKQLHSLQFAKFRENQEISAQLLGVKQKLADKIFGEGDSRSTTIKKSTEYKQLRIESTNAKGQSKSKDPNLNRFMNAKGSLQQRRTSMDHAPKRSLPRQDKKQRAQQLPLPSQLNSDVTKQLQREGNKRQHNNFDLQMHFKQQVMSQQMTNCLNPVSSQFCYSSQEEAKVKKSRGSKQLSHGKKKSDQLADLVAQQFKITPIKEKYFSTDLM